MCNYRCCAFAVIIPIFAVIIADQCGLLGNYENDSDDESCGESTCSKDACSSDPTSRKSCCLVNPVIRNQMYDMQSMPCCIPNIGSLYLGASVATTRDTQPYKHPRGLPTSEITNKPEYVIEPSEVTPGKNWHFTGNGTIVVKLFELSHISGFTILHPPKCQLLAGYEMSAPKDFYVMGMEKLDDKEPFLFGNYVFEYNTGNNVQLFPVQYCSKNKYQFIEFRFTSNHGNPEYTALYKVQIHGDMGEPSFTQEQKVPKAN